jgi:hypothetical protein
LGSKVASQGGGKKKKTLKTKFSLPFNFQWPPTFSTESWRPWRKQTKKEKNLKSFFFTLASNF